MSNALKEVVSLLKKKKKLEKKLGKLNLKEFKGLKVKMTKAHRKWFKQNLNKIFNCDDNGTGLKNEEKISFQARKLLIKKSRVGKVLSATKDEEDGVVLNIEFIFPEMDSHSEEILLDAASVKLA